MKRRNLTRHLLLAALLLAATLVASPAAPAASTPVRLTFAKENQFDGTWKGTVAGDISGDLTTELKAVRVSGDVWHVTFDWIIDAGEMSFTARLLGTINTATGRVVMNGRVVEGYLLGARVAERGQLVNPEADAAGKIRIMPATAG